MALLPNPESARQPLHGLGHHRLLALRGQILAIVVAERKGALQEAKESAAVHVLVVKVREVPGHPDALLEPDLKVLLVHREQHLAPSSVAVTTALLWRARGGGYLLGGRHGRRRRCRVRVVRARRRRGGRGRGRGPSFRPCRRHHHHGGSGNGRVSPAPRGRDRGRGEKEQHRQSGRDQQPHRRDWERHLLEASRVIFCLSRGAVGLDIADDYCCHSHLSRARGAPSARESRPMETTHQTSHPCPSA